MRLTELRHALIASGCNKADQVIALITACNERGTVNGPKIVSAVSDLGYDKRYVAIHLSKMQGAVLSGITGTALLKATIKCTARLRSPGFTW